MELASSETIKQAAIADMGLAFLLPYTAGPEPAAGQRVVVDIAGLPLVRRWHIVNLRGKPLSPAAAALRYFVLEQGEALIARQFSGAAPAESAA
jgi:DNA-binding transcriptional LysR family regulator